MGETVRAIKSIRNRKTTSRLASDLVSRPRHVARDTNNSSRYCLKRARDLALSAIARIRDLDEKADILWEYEDERWCRESLLNSVVRDINLGVANDNQEKEQKEARSGNRSSLRSLLVRPDLPLIRSPRGLNGADLMQSGPQRADLLAVCKTTSLAPHPPTTRLAARLSRAKATE